MVRALVVLAVSFICVVAALADGPVPGSNPSALTIETTSLSTPAALSPNGDGAFDAVTATATLVVRPIAGLTGVGPEGSDRLEHRFVIKFSLTGSGPGGTATVRAEVDIAAEECGPGRTLEVPLDVQWGALTPSGALPAGSYALSFHAELQRIDTIIFAQKPQKVIVHELGQADAALGNVLVDFAPPTLVVNEPIEGATVPSLAVRCAGTVDDPGAQVTVDGRLVPIVNLQWERTITYSTPGPHAILVEAVDSLQNKAQPVTRHFICGEPPRLWDLTPAPGFFKTSTITVAGRVGGTAPIVITVFPGDVQAEIDGETFSAQYQLAAVSTPQDVEVRAVGIAGLTTSAWLHGLVLDDTPPQFELMTPVPAYTNKARTPVQVRVTDLNLEHVTIAGTVVAASGDVFVADVDLALGVNTIIVEALDKAHNSARLELQTTLDRTQPGLFIDFPSANAWANQSSIAISGRVEDEHLASLTISGAAVPVVGGTFSHVAALPLEGANSILLEAVDLAQNLTSTVLVVSRDTQVPLATLSSPAEGSFTNLPVVHVAGHVNEANVAGVFLNDAALPAVSGPFEAELTLPEGAQTAALRVVDRAGNQGEAVVHFTVDRSGPALDVTSPQDGSTTNESQAVVKGNIHDALAGVRSLLVNGVLVPLNAGAFEAPVVLAEGDNDISVVATDNAENSTSRSLSVRYEPGPSGPELILSSPPENYVTSASDVLVAGTASGSGPLVVKINGVEAPLAGHEFALRVPLSGNGPQTIVAEVTDSSSQVASFARTVVRDALVPAIAVLSPANGRSVNTSTVTVRGTVSDVTLESVRVAGKLAELQGFGFQVQISLVPGGNDISVVARDMSGLQSTFHYYLNHYVQEDLAFYCPNWVRTPQLLIQGTAYDPSIERVTSGSTFCLVGADGTFVLSVPLLSEGANDLVIEAPDDTGHDNRTTRTVGLDTVAPVPLLSAPLADPVTSASTSVDVTVVETGSGCYHLSVGVWRDWAFSYRDYLVPANRATVQLDLAEGLNRVVLECWDEVGNVGSTEFNVRRETACPELIISSPATGFVTDANEVEVRGIVIDQDLLSVTANGVAATLEGVAFHVTVPINEGTTTISVTARDRQNNTSTGNLRVSRAPAVPDLFIYSIGHQGTATGPLVYVDGALGSGTDVAAPFTAFINGTEATLYRDSQHRYRFWGIVQLSTGASTLTIEERDSLGHCTVQRFDVYADLAAPDLSLSLSGIDGWTANSSYSLSGLVPDALITSVSVSGVAVPVGSSRTFYRSVPLVQGPNQIWVEAALPDGRRTRVSFRMSLDNQAPVATLTSPVSGALTNKPWFPVLGSAADAGSGLRYVRVTTQMGVSPYTKTPYLAVVAGNGYSCQVKLVEGANYLEVYAYDWSGWRSGALSASLTLDTISPSLSVVAPLDGLSTNLAQVTVSGSTSDASGITSLTLNGDNVTLTGSNFSTIASLALGWNGLELVTTDRAGNRTSRLLHVSRGAQPAPYVNILSPTDGAVTANDTVVISGEVFDNDMDSVRVNGVLAQVESGRYYATIPLALGQNPILVVARDLAGAQATAAVGLVWDGHQIDTQPTLLLSPCDGEVVHTITPRILVSYRDLGVGVDPASFVLKVDGHTAVGVSVGPSSASYLVPLEAPLSVFTPVLLEASIADLGGRVGTASALITVAPAQDIVGPPQLSSIRAQPSSFSPGLNPYTPPEAKRATIRLDVSRPCTALLNIYSVKSGRLVRTLTSNTPLGTAPLAEWDGRTADGKLLEDGQYRIEATASDAQSRQSSPVTTWLQLYY